MFELRARVLHGFGEEVFPLWNKITLESENSSDSARFGSLDGERVFWGTNPRLQLGELPPNRGYGHRGRHEGAIRSLPRPLERHPSHSAEAWSQISIATNDADTAACAPAVL